MTRFIFLFLALLLPCTVVAEIVVPTRTIRANVMILPDDVTFSPGQAKGAFDRLEDVIGQEARTTLYAGRLIRVDDIGPPALIERNQIVSLRFQADGLTIMTEGRALQRAGAGDRIRIMNLSSRATLFGLVQKDGSVQVFH